MPKQPVSPPDGYIHDGSRSWWSGIVLARCGKRFAAHTTSWRPFARVTCPDCRTR